MPFNTLAYVSGTDIIDRSLISQTTGWKIYAHNNPGYDYVSWPHLSRAILYLLTVRSYKFGGNHFDLNRGPFLKEEIIQYGTELMQHLTGAAYDFHQDLDLIPHEGDIAVCGFISAPHFALYGADGFRGQPSVSDRHYAASISNSGKQLVQYWNDSGRSQTHELHGFFRTKEQ